MNVQNLTVKLLYFYFFRGYAGGGQSFFLVPDFALLLLLGRGFFSINYVKSCNKIRCQWFGVFFVWGIKDNRFPRDSSWRMVRAGFLNFSH